MIVLHIVDGKLHAGPLPLEILPTHHNRFVGSMDEETQISLLLFSLAASIGLNV